MADSPDEETRLLGEQSEVAPFGEDGDFKSGLEGMIEERLVRKGKAAYLANYNFNILAYEEKFGIRFWRGSEKLMSENPYIQWITKRRWTMNEELKMNQLLFIDVILKSLINMKALIRLLLQAGLVLIDVKFEQYEWSIDDGAWEPLGLENCRLQFIAVGLFISVGLLMSLWELLAGQYNFYKLTFLGLLGCLFVTCENLFLFSLIIVSNDYTIDWVQAEDRKWIVFSILGIAAVESYVFILCSLLKSIVGIQRISRSSF